jgi:hypothetical protein
MMNLNQINQKSPYFKQFKKDIEFFNSKKIKDIDNITLSIAFEKYIKMKVNKYEVKLLHSLLGIKS